MNFPITLSLYIARHFLQAIIIAMMGLMSVIFLLDVVELIRRTAGLHDVGMALVIKMAFLKAPTMSARILPFAVMIGAMTALTRLTRTSELVAARAAGMSVWQFLRPAWMLAALLGILFVGVVNPVSAAMLERFEQLEARYISGRPSLLAISASGLWLRDFDDHYTPRQERIFHALRLSQRDNSLSKVIIFHFDQNNVFLGRMDAESATLKKGYWQLQHVTLSTPGKPSEIRKEYNLQTALTLAQIQDGKSTPVRSSK
jgi:lipopolysaccharide export system permease protein